MLIIHISLCLLYLLVCGAVTALFHHKKLYIADGPHILFAIMFWPITLPCMLGYVVPTYLISRLSEINKD